MYLAYQMRNIDFLSKMATLVGRGWGGGGDQDGISSCIPIDGDQRIWSKFKIDSLNVCLLWLVCFTYMWLKI